jgi:hypothetical protein
MDDLLATYIRQEVQDWFDNVTDREPEENEIEATVTDVYKEASELIQACICNACT